MRQAQLEGYRQRLFDLRSRLRDEIGRSIDTIREEIRPPGEVSDLPTHNADHDSEGIDKEFVLEQNQEGIMNQVEAALERIDAGTYGRCQECGDPIASERLHALPYTAYCVECEQARETESEGLDRAVPGRPVRPA